MIGGALSGASGLLFDSGRTQKSRAWHGMKETIIAQQAAAMERDYIRHLGYDPGLSDAERSIIRRHAAKELQAGGINQDSLEHLKQNKAKMSFKQKLEIETREWLKGALD